MKLYGLTGGIGMGKSTATEILEGWGVPAADTDFIAREVVEPGQPALAEIADAFGSDMLDPDGRLRRDALARRVFADTEARRRLESMLHPRIRDVWRTRVQAWRLAGRPLAVVVIPLLFETGAEAELDATICVACTAASQQERLQARGWTADEIERRLRAQLPVGEKMARANFVVWTEGTLEVHARQLMRAIPEVQAASG